MASSMNPLYLSGSEFRMSSTDDRKYKPCISATNSTKNVEVPPPPPPTAKKSRFSAYTKFRIELATKNPMNSSDRYWLNTLGST